MWYTNRSEAIRDLIRGSLIQEECFTFTWMNKISWKFESFRGKAREIKKIAERLIGTRGVKHGEISLITTGRDLT